MGKDEILDNVRAWGVLLYHKGNKAKALSEEQLEKFRYLVQETMAKRDTTLMNDILEAISPAVTCITAHPTIINQPVWLRQAIEISALIGMVRGVSLDLRFARSEKDIKESYLHTMILEAINKLAKKTTEKGYKILKEGSEEDTVKQIQDWLQKFHGQELSIPAISHAVRALDRSGFIMRLGPSKLRCFVLTRKGAKLIKK